MSKKWILILSVCVLCVLMVTGCMRNTATPSPTPITSPITSPLSTSSPNPNTMLPSLSPGTSPSASPGASANDEQLAKMADEIKAEVEKLSEIKSASVVVSENTALVGVEFDDAYKGEINDRITQMVEDKAKEVDQSINDIFVTDDKEVKDEIETMRSKLKSGDLIADLKADFEGLINRIKPKA